MNGISKNALIGYPAGIISGITYGLNPLFAMPLMRDGASVESVLFFRYGFAVLILGAILLADRQSFRVNMKQAGVLLILGLLYTSSSIMLFSAYNYMPSGLATMIVFVSPVLVALMMVFLKVVPSWQVWLAIAATFVGVIIMTQGGPAESINPIGVVLWLGSALAYALFVVIINRNKSISTVSDSVLTFYSLLVGAVVFMIQVLCSGQNLMTGIDTNLDWLNLVGLAIFPTIISTASLAVASRNIGATKASVLGVFEPVTAIMVGTLVFGEPLTNNILIGMIIAMGAVTFMIISTKR